MLKLISREPMPDDAFYEIWRDGEEVVYRLVVPPDERLRRFDSLKERKEMQRTKPHV